MFCFRKTTKEQVMAKHRVHEVREKKKDDMIIRIGKDFLLNAERRARRQAAIESGNYRCSGTGVHGGNDKARNRRDRRDSRLSIRRAGYND
jgi:hypothetical protein